MKEQIIKKKIRLAKGKIEGALDDLKSGMERNHPYEDFVDHVIRELDDLVLRYDEDYNPVPGGTGQIKKTGRGK